MNPSAARMPSEAQTSTPAGADDPRQNTCAVCGAAGTKSSCGRCRVPQYCGRECQAKHWEAGHCAECASLPKGLGRVVLRPAPPGEATSLAKSAARTLEDRGEQFYRCEAGPGPVAAYFERIAEGMVLKTSPAEFVQLLALALSKEARSVFAIGEGETAPWVTLKALGCSVAKFAPAVFAPADADARSALKMATGAAGLWVAGPDKRGNYLGLTGRGPRRQPLEAWHREMIGRLEGASVPGLGLVRGLGDLDFDQFALARAAE